MWQKIQNFRQFQQPYHVHEVKKKHSPVVHDGKTHNCLDCGKRFEILGNVKKQYSPVFHDGKMPSKRSNVTKSHICT